MISTTLEEVVNGWLLILYDHRRAPYMEKFVYETYEDAKRHRYRFELEARPKNT